MNDFTVTADRRDPRTVVVGVDGELDLDTADHLWSRLAPLLAPEALVILDAALMPFVDSSGLRVLLQASRRARETGAVFRVAALSAPVARVLELTGVEEYLAVYPNAAAALNA